MNAQNKKNTTHTTRTFASFLFSSSSLSGYVLGGEWRAGGGKGAMHIFLSLLPSVAPLVAPIWKTTSNTPTHFPGKPQPCILVHFDKYGGSSFGQTRTCENICYMAAVYLLHVFVAFVDKSCCDWGWVVRTKPLKSFLPTRFTFGFICIFSSSGNSKPTPKGQKGKKIGPQREVDILMPGQFYFQFQLCPKMGEAIFSSTALAWISTACT